MKVIADAATHSLTHRSIQPANLMILPGAAFDGGWPRVKLLNFGLGGLKVQSDDSRTHEFAPSLPPEFSSPEQLENKAVDFRSDIFSLGAAMWFLLTGSAPSPLPTTESGPRLSAPTGVVPRFVRNLVSGMVRTNPEERPQNPSTFAEKIHACLQKAERQTAFTRGFAPAAISTIPIREKKRIAPALALAAAIAVLASLSAFYFVRSQRESKPLGVIIGVPETAEASPPAVTASASPSPVVNQVVPQAGPVAQQSPTQAASPTPTADNVSSSPQLATNNRMAEPPVPAEGPSETKQAPVNSESPPAEKHEPAPPDLPNRTELAAKDSLATTTSGDEPSSSPAHAAAASKRSDSNASKTKSRRQRVAKSSARRPLPPLHVGSASARLVGITPSGNWVLRLPSGETIVTPPAPNIDDAPVISHRRVRRVPRPIPLEDEAPVIVLPPGF
jgi:serine/threonine protein kinase